MDRGELLDAVLVQLAEQQAEPAVGTALTEYRRSGDPFACLLAGFASFMAGTVTEQCPIGPDHDPEVLLLGAAVEVLAATKDGTLDATAALERLTGLAQLVDASRATAAFAVYAAAEGALASARLDLAQELLDPGRPGAHEIWAGHPYAPVMLACVARTQIFSGNIDRALALLEPEAPPTVPGDLVRATRAVAAGNAADLSLMHALVAEVEAADVAPVDHIGRGVHLLLAFSVIVFGDVLGAVRHLLRAGGGADLERLTIVDRMLGYELLVSAAVAEEDPVSAQAWEGRAVHWATHRTAAPTVSRIRSRVALLEGDAEEAERHAVDAVVTAGMDHRAIERAEAEIVRARARIAGDRAPDATRDLRAAVVASDLTGHAAVRLAATRELRPTRRRLPPPFGTGWESLSARERDVAELILAGVDNSGIAANLSLSATTVRTHATRVLTAFGVGTRIGLLAATREPPQAPSRTPGLTTRQAEVADLVATGRTNAEIAELLAISVKSVERHVTDVLVRWEARSRFELAHRWWAEQAG